MVEYFTKNDVTARDCVAGDNHTGVITTEDELYVFGNNNEYQLGPSDDDEILTPTKLKMEGSIMKVAMRDEHTALILDTSSNHVF